VQRAATTVVKRIAGQFTGGGDKFGLFHQAKAQLDGPRPHYLADFDNIFGRSNW
jgi:hypothetical protein